VLEEGVAENVMRRVAMDRVVVHQPHLEPTLVQERAEAVFTSIGAGA
jgi:hypothetical protein